MTDEGAGLRGMLSHIQRLDDRGVRREPLTLTDFLLARIAEDEVKPRGIGALPLIFDELGEHPTGEVKIPARWKAECETKRRIVEEALAARFIAFDPDSTLGDKFLDEFAQGILSLLALPYADHRDYSEEWKP